MNANFELIRSAKSAKISVLSIGIESTKSSLVTLQYFPEICRKTFGCHKRIGPLRLSGAPSKEGSGVAEELRKMEPKSINWPKNGQRRAKTGAANLTGCSWFGGRFPAASPSFNHHLRSRTFGRL
jgi:hypothetical protein